MALKIKEFLEQVEADKKNPRRCGCGCGEPLEPRVDGERHQMDGKEVNSDCYYEAFGKEIDEHPIGAAHKLRP